MMKRRLLWSAALIAELFVLYAMYSQYEDVKQRILNVQGQFAERYADLHQEWLQVSGAIVLVMLILPFTLYYLVRSFRK
jgi:hypothetical protein